MNIKNPHMKEVFTTVGLLLMMSIYSLLLFSCHKREAKYHWEPGISAPLYYPIGDCSVDFGNAGNGNTMSFDNGWGDTYGSISSANRYKEIPDSVFIRYNSSVENFTYRGRVPLLNQKLDSLFQKYDTQKDFSAKLVVGMAPGGWIRVWFQTLNQKSDKYVSIEVAKAQLKGEYDDSSNEKYKTKDFENWGKYYTYWQLHGIPYEAWANNEKEYNIMFDFDKPNHREVGFSYVSEDGTYFQGEKTLYDTLYHQKLPVQIEQIAWLGKSQKSYNCKVTMPKNFKKYVEQKKMKTVNLRLEIENDDEHAVLYLVNNNIKEKIIRFRNKISTADEIKNNEYAYATEIEYFIP